MADAPDFVTWSDPSLEREVLDAVSLDVPWKLVERFSELVRTSGSAEERQAVEAITGELDKAGVPYRLHTPECFISVPLRASVKVGDKTYRAKTVAMSVSTGEPGITGELVYVPGSHGGGNNDFFLAGIDLSCFDVAGKIVITEGMASPGKTTDVMRAGAIGRIFVNPGQAIHEGICTTIWGTPDLDSMGRQPTIPVAGVNQPDGQALIAAAKAGATVQ